MNRQYKEGDLLLVEKTHSMVLYHIDGVDDLGYYLSLLDSEGLPYVTDHRSLMYSFLEIENKNHVTLAFDPESTKSENSICACDLMTLMRVGCACGGV